MKLLRIARIHWDVLAVVDARRYREAKFRNELVILERDA